MLTRINYLKGVIFLLLLLSFSQQINSQDYIINDISELETIAKNNKKNAVSIAYYLAAVLAIFSLINVFKGVREGDRGSYRRAAAFLAAFFIYLGGIYVVNTFVLP